MNRVPRQLDYRLLAQSIEPSGIRLTQVQVQQLGDGLHACRQATAALLCLAAGATDPTLESEARRLQSVLAACGEDLASILASVRIRP